MKETLTAKEIHGQAIHAREQEHNFAKALSLLGESLAIAESDSEEMVGIAGSMQNTYQHLYDKTQNMSYLIFAECLAKVAAKISEDKNFEEKALPYRDLGNIQSKLESYNEAVDNYKKSLESTDSPSLSRPGVHGEILGHLGFAEYMSGDQESGIKNLNEAIAELEKDTEANKYEHDVWLSGALMRKAKALHDKESLEKAREIIDANPELVLRKQQLEKLASEF